MKISVDNRKVKEAAEYYIAAATLHFGAALHRAEINPAKFDAALHELVEEFCNLLDGTTHIPNPKKRLIVPVMGFQCQAAADVKKAAEYRKTKGIKFGPTPWYFPPAEGTEEVLLVSNDNFAYHPLSRKIVTRVIRTMKKKGA
jgi:hypothetical protein